MLAQVMLEHCTQFMSGVLLDGVCVCVLCVCVCVLCVCVQGCREGHGKFQKDQPDWMAAISSDYGYSKMTVHNATHLSIQQISTDQVCM